MKMKFGTQLDEEVYHELKITSAKRRIPIGEIVEEALTYYFHRPHNPKKSKTGLGRLLEKKPKTVSDSEFQKIMATDYYDQ
jgi:hypothetical protein